MYFDTEEKQQQLFKEIQEWMGTPYKHRCMVKGKGCDCIHLVAGVFIELGIIKNQLKYAEYAPDWHLHSSRELLYEYTHINLNVEDIPISETPKNGDILLYKFGKACSHSAIYFDKHIYHSINNKKVIESFFEDPYWRSKLKYILRLK